MISGMNKKAPMQVPGVNQNLLIGQGVSNFGVTLGAVYFDTYLQRFDSKAIEPLVSAQFFVWRSPAVLRGHSSLGFKHCYGMTECCSCITAHHLEKFTYEYPYCVTIILQIQESKSESRTGKGVSL
ncbi:uncharacterized protein N7498_006019 [Penicillium cinerascens]|uniref:Uncharacterized protein n=1 Tax=Penicillium cinerascens TaxID=70096 RepID=A0A9W9MHF4_9EURO|nr:uncharacterized protein N7498_006019 [Penicillium cinerascens]KAJ5201356.1 hypothetical protein N7498_006019 [Penicillium cinerascens]